MKKLLTIAVLAFASLQPLRAATVDEGTGQVVILTGKLTNNVTYTLPTTSGIVRIDKQHQVGVAINFLGDQAGTGNIILNFRRMSDGSLTNTMETVQNASLSFTNALNGTNQVAGFHQIPDTLVGSAHSLKLFSVQNADASASGTNATIAIVKKIER